MTGQAFFVLTALADGLYGVLDRLAAGELIEPDREEAHDGRLRRYYRLTGHGRGLLADEAELRAATARVVRARLRLASADAAG
jgi:PadR family transcriptional regulator, regulatory protein PadR